MALIECPECKRAVSDRADACPGCGHPIATDAAGSANKSPAPQQSPKPTKDQAKDQDPVKLSDPKAPTENIADKEMAWMTPLWSAFMACLAWVVGRIGTAVVYAITGVKAVPIAQSAFPFSATFIAILWVPLSIWVVLFMLMNVKPNRELRAEEQAAAAAKKLRAAAAKQERRAAAAKQERRAAAAAAKQERRAAAAAAEQDQTKDQDPVTLSDPKAPTENIADKEEAWEMTWGTAISIPVVLYLLYRAANWLLKALTGLELNPADLF